MMRLPWKSAILAVTIFFAIDTQNTAHALDPVVINAETIQAIRTLADQFAEAMAHHGDLTSKSPITLLSQHTLRRMANFQTLLSDWSKTYSAESQDSYQKNRAADFMKNGTEIGNIATARTSSKTISYILAPLIITLPLTGPDLYNLIMQNGDIAVLKNNLTGMGIITGLFYAAMVGVGLSFPTYKNEFAQIEQQRNHQINEEILKIFFTRLSELGIRYDKKNPEKWLSETLRGNPVTDWTSLTQKERRQWSESYQEFLTQIARLYESISPELSQEMLALVKKVASQTPSKWWPYWGQESIRKLAQTISESLVQLKALDDKYEFSKHPEIHEFLEMDRRPFFEFPEVFAPATRAFFVDSGAYLPMEIAAHLPRIKDLGGIISIEHQTRVVKPGSAKTNSILTIRFPDSEITTIELSFSSDYSVPREASDTRHLHLKFAAENRIPFASRMSEAARESNLGSMIEEAHQKRFPEKHCAGALSQPQTVVVQILETVAQ